MADEENEILTDIVRLQRQVSALIAVSEHLFTLAGSTQRFTDASDLAYKEIPKLIEHAKNPEA